jgi:hypothetical protein
MSKHKLRIPDPRIAISKHIGWLKADDAVTFSSPEPDAYNYAIRASKPLNCLALDYQIFYKQPNDQWWSVYYVAEHEKEDFMRWLSKQDFEVYWDTKSGATLTQQTVDVF